MTTPEFTRNRENYCYRHPDRQSFVLCQRCLRTICPQCQTQAAVGVICPECLAAQRREQSPAQRRAQRRWGRGSGRAVAAVSSGQPVATYAIIAVTAAAYVLSLLIPQLSSWLGFAPGYLYPQLTGVFQPWRLLSTLLVHSTFWHVGLNMLSLWMIGRILEPMLGRGRFLSLYLISGLGGSVCVALLAPSSYVVGASGAIFGLFGALVVIARHLGANLTGILIVLGINLAIGFVPGLGISWQAHVGGVVAGALAGLIFARTRRADRRGLQIALLLVLVVVLLLLLLIPPVIYA